MWRKLIFSNLWLKIGILVHYKLYFNAVILVFHNFWNSAIFRASKVASELNLTNFGQIWHSLIDATHPWPHRFWPFLQGLCIIGIYKKYAKTGSVLRLIKLLHGKNGFFKFLKSVVFRQTFLISPCGESVQTDLKA